jgi:hypothetical protein
MLIPRAALLDSLICAGAFSLLTLLIVREVERARLASIARASVPPTATDEDAALCLAREVFLSARRRRDSGPSLVPWKLLLGGPLRARPRSEVGGRLHGLYVALLDAMGIRARQITLTHREGLVRHSVVEVVLAGGNVIIDVEYGVSYRDFFGDGLGLEQLQRGSQPWFEPIPGIESGGYPDTYYELDFAHASAATETERGVRQIALRFLQITTFGAADRFPLRPALEWPHVLLALAGLPILAVLLFLKHLVAP